MPLDIHKIPENSAFFQGHIGQFFSKDKFSFEILANYEDRDKSAQINIARYKPIFLRLMNNFIHQRQKEGYSLELISADNLVIQGIKFVDNEKDDGLSGRFKLSPQAAICKKDKCNQYFLINEGRTCGHTENDDWEQVTFLASCDVCGRHVPMHLMTNINHDCKKCSQKNSLKKLKWAKKDDLSSYSVECIHCHSTEGLYFYECDHTIHKTGQILSTKPKKKFKGVPSRSQTIIHPYVVSIPDIPQEYEIDSSGRRNRDGMFLSEAFRELFSPNLEESLLYLSEFHEVIKNDTSFWELRKIGDLCEELDLNILDKKEWNSTNLLRLIRSIIKEVKVKISEGGDSNRLKSRYGVEKISDALIQVKDIGVDENDLQGLFLLTSVSSTEKGKLVPKKRDAPIFPPEDFTGWLDIFGLKQIIHIANFNMIQALIGTITGSTRREPLLFDPIMTTEGNNKKPTVFVRDFLTEGIVFQLDFIRLLYWLDRNKLTIDPTIKILPFEGDAENHFRSIISQNENCKEAITILLHTYCHMLIQQSTIDTGLEIQSLAERIFPKTASFFIYSTSGLNIGGLEFTYDYHLEDWFKRMNEIASDCPQDPACMIDEGGSCNACSYVPEIVCERFNQDLDRSTLVGGPRFEIGFLNKIGYMP
nr:hypothetical protein [uncultured Methanoregula sp.]